MFLSCVSAFIGLLTQLCVDQWNKVKPLGVISPVDKQGCHVRF